MVWSVRIRVQVLSAWAWGMLVALRSKSKVQAKIYTHRGHRSKLGVLWFVHEVVSLTLIPTEA